MSVLSETKNPKLKVDWQFHPLKAYPLTQATQVVGEPMHCAQGDWQATQLPEVETGCDTRPYPEEQERQLEGLEQVWHPVGQLTQVLAEVLR